MKTLPPSGRQPPQSPGRIQPVPAVTEADLARVLEREFARDWSQYVRWLKDGSASDGHSS